MLLNRMRNTMIHSKISNVFFLKMFIFFILMTSIPVLFIGYLSITHSSNRIIQNVSLSNLSMMKSKKITIDQKLETINTMIVQSVFSDDVWNLLRTDALDSNSHLIMKSVIDTFVSITNNNPVVDSIYFYDTKHDFVLTSHATTGTKYKKSEFWDPNSLHNDMSENFKLLPPSAELTAGSASKNLITYVRKIDIFSQNTGFIVLNLNADILFEDLDTTINSGMKMVVMGDDSSIFYSNSDWINSLDQRSMDALTHQDSPNAIINLANTKHFITTVPSDFYDWKYIYIQNYDNLIRPAQMFNKIILIALVSVLFVALFIVYLLSSYLYKPVNGLLLSISSIPKPTNSREKNEFKVIHGAINHLRESNSDLLSKYKVTLPYFHRHSIHDLLSNSNFDHVQFEKVVHLLDIQLDYKTYYIVIIDFEALSYYSTERQEVEQFINKMQDQLTFISSKENDFRTILIINTDLNKLQLTHKLNRMKIELGNDSAKPIVSASEPFEHINELSKYYQPLLKSHEYKLFMGIQDDAIHPEQFNAYYPDDRCSSNSSDLQDKLIQYINAFNEQKAIETLQTLTNDHLADSNESDNYIRYIYFQLCMGILNNMVMQGIDHRQLNLLPYDLHHNLQNAGNLQSLQDCVIQLIQVSIMNIQEQKNKTHSDTVSKVIEFIDNNYNRDLSLEEIAGTVHLNPRYLSTIFKSEKGITIFDYVTHLRMVKASDLLVNTSKRIVDITAEIGFNSVQSFIRAFKQYYKTTPLNYRKNNAS